MFFSMGALAFTVFYYMNITRGPTVLFNAGKIIMAEIIVLCLANFLMWAIDPFGFRNVIPFWLTRIFFIISFPLTSTVYSTLLFHWADVYMRIVKTYTRQKQLMKINSTYTPNTNIQDILPAIHTLNKIKIPLFVSITVEWIFMIIREVLLQLKIIGTGYGSRGFWVQYMWLGESR
jgi:hypothetical protein